MPKTQTHFSLGLVMTLLFMTLPICPPMTRAATNLDVVINEVAWMGSLDASTDEWIELKNNTTASIDLAGWVIEDDGGAQLYTLSSGVIAPHGYFLIEHTDNAVSTIPADAVNVLSLANTGDSLVLKDNLNQIIDTVNSTGGMWFAGNNTTKATMERVDSLVSGDLSSNWLTNIASTGALASAGSTILGTPRGPNSVSGPDSPVVTLTPSSASPLPNSILTVTASVSSIANLFSYGFYLTYDPAVLDFQSAEAGTFLSENSLTQTSFQSGLENDIEGTLIIGEARTIEPETGASGSGELFIMTFLVIGSPGSQSAIAAAPGTFLSNPSEDISTIFSNANVIVTPETAPDPVQDAIASEGTERYSIMLSWTAPAMGADSYQVFRRNTQGAYVLIGTPTTTTLIDQDGVTNGGNIVPDLTYSYQVIAVKNSLESTPVTVTGEDSRGLRGDNTRSDNVDGRDLEKLAKHWAEDTAHTNFDALIDTSYDGLIEGNDLIDMGATWALTY